jgi:hypothetical protein
MASIGTGDSLMMVEPESAEDRPVAPAGVGPGRASL